MNKFYKWWIPSCLHIPNQLTSPGFLTLLVRPCRFLTGDTSVQNHWWYTRKNQHGHQHFKGANGNSSSTSTSLNFQGVLGGLPNSSTFRHLHRHLFWSHRLVGCWFKESTLRSDFTSLSWIWNEGESENYRKYIVFKYSFKDHSISWNRTLKLPIPRHPVIFSNIPGMFNDLRNA